MDWHALALGQSLASDFLRELEDLTVSTPD